MLHLNSKKCEIPELYIYLLAENAICSEKSKLSYPGVLKIVDFATLCKNILMVYFYM